MKTKQSIVSNILEHSPNPSFISWNYKQLADYYSTKDNITAAVYYKYAILYSTFYSDLMNPESPAVQATPHVSYEVKCRSYEADRELIVAWIFITWLACMIAENLRRRISMHS